MKRPLVSFCLLTYGITIAVMLPQVLYARGFISLSLPTHWETLAAFVPSVVAVLLLLGAGGVAGLRPWLETLTRWRVGSRWLLFTLLSPLLVLVLALGLVTLQTGRLPLLGNLSLGLGGAGGLVELLLFGALLQALGEEPGWRGFLLAGLRKSRGPLLATLILAPIWIGWHVPAFLSRPEFGLGQFIGLSLGLLSAAVWLTFIFDATRSVLMVVLWHALINLWRGTALAISAPVFQAFGMVVLGGALLIVGYWIISARPGSFEQPTGVS